MSVIDLTLEPAQTIDLTFEPFLGTPGPIGETGPEGPMGPEGPTGPSVPLSQLPDVDPTGIQSGNSLEWNGALWVPSRYVKITDRDLATASLLPAGAKAGTIPPNTHDISADHTLTSGRLHLFAITLFAGMLISSITFRSRTTAMVTGTNQWFSLWSAAYSKLGVTNNDGATAWAAAADKTLALTSPYLIPTTAKYFLGIVVTAATPPSLLSIGHSYHGVTLCVEADSGLTTPASAPTTATAGGNLGRWAYAYVS
jgi:hypothetical protein